MSADRRRHLASFALLALLAGGFAHAADVVVIPGDPPGVGFNDPTPATPVGGNPGTTVGEQALNVFQYAANQWGARLVSQQPILVIAFFVPLTCTATSGVLGAAAPNWYFANVDPARGGKPLLPDTFYPAALAEKITRQDIVADPNDPFEIFTIFNSRLGQPGCLTGRGWYYGLDNRAPANLIDLTAVVLHEFGHGLGFTVSPTSSSTGNRAIGYPSIWESQMLDVTTGKRWIEMTSGERAVSARNDGGLVWAGRFASNVVPSVLAPSIELVTLEPSTIPTEKTQPASFGPQIRGPVRAPLSTPADGGGVSPTDGCEPYPAGTDLSGTIVLVDRGTCTFTLKVKNAQDAGAEAVAIANNNPVGLPGMGGTDPTITIPSVGISQALGAALRAVPGSPLVSLERNTVERSGTVDNLPRLYAPTAFAPGSSVSHYDTVLTPNVLMEPFINPDLTHSVKHPDDLTVELLRDLGW